MSWNNMNWVAMAIGLNNLKKNGITDSSEKSKTLLFPMLIKDPMASVLTVDLSTKKAVETKKAESLAAENSSLAASNAAALKMVADFQISANQLRETIANKVKENVTVDELKTFLNDSVLKSRVFEPVISEGIRNAIFAVVPELKAEKPDSQADVAILKEILNEA